MHKNKKGVIFLFFGAFSHMIYLWLKKKHLALNFDEIVLEIKENAVL